MKKKKYYFIFLMSMLIISLKTFSQTNQEKRKIINKTNVSRLIKISNFQKKKAEKEKELALEKAKEKGWEVIINDTINNSYSELMRLDAEGNPIYFEANNYGAGLTARVNHLYLGGSLGLNIEGQNMLAGEWDSGRVRATHELLSGRVQQMDAPASISNHSTHVAGTIIGTDQVKNGNARGMAFKANLHAYDWNNDVSEVANAAANGLLVSNHSYGYNPFFVPQYMFGKYIDDSRNFDEVMYNAPYYLFVAAAGNARNRIFNVSDGGYDLLSGHGCSKNSMIVAAVNEQINYMDPASVVMSDFSSWGPTDDGRIKPDLSAKGVNTFSSFGGTNFSYSTISGTSMASPSVTGTLLLMQQYYNKINGSFMFSSTLRGLALHTADEAGANPGPDYEFGWGLINAKKAAELIKSNGTTSLISENSLSQGETFSRTFNALGTEPLMATICWTDPEGIVNTSTVEDLYETALVNDLDIRITHNSTVFYPWKLDPNNPSAAATHQDNTVDNIEKIQINNPIGSYTLTVTHKGTLHNSDGVINSQNFSLIISGISFTDFYLTTTNEKEIICESNDAATFHLNLNTIVGYNNDNVIFSTSGLPTGVNTTFSPLSMNQAGNFDLNLVNLSSLNVGDYPFTIIGQSATENFSLSLELQVINANFSNFSLIQPANNLEAVLVNANLEWEVVENAQEYDIEIATDVSFTNIIESATVSQNSYQASLLDSETIYYWRVRPKNQCGVGVFSSPFSFKTSCEVVTNTISICDMTTVDYDNDSNPDGIINLFDEYNAIPGVTPVSNADGTWFDPNYNFALDVTTGNLHSWDLKTSSETENTHQFWLVDPNSTCFSDGVILSLNVVLGPFSGFAVPTINENDVNVEICDDQEIGCFTVAYYDLYQTFLSIPNAHTNGIWSYNGFSTNFLGIQDNRYLIVDVPYQPGPPLIDEETFELTYTVSGISPCNDYSSTNVKISVIRSVSAGTGNTLNVGEAELINGDYDVDINLLEDDYLINEDIEGVWLVNSDPTGQIDNPLDSFINLKNIYNDLLQTNPRFGCEEFTFDYYVDSRAAICSSDTSQVIFRFFEDIRPFEQEEIPEFCLKHNNPDYLDLNNYLVFTNENNTVYNYPPLADKTEWKFISGPSDLGLDTFSGEVSLSNLDNNQDGTYVFEYTVFENYFCDVDDSTNPEIINEISIDGCIDEIKNTDHPSTKQSAIVTIVIHPYNYPGEDTNLDFCETELSDSVNLIALLETNGVETIYQGDAASWIDLDSGDTINSPFTLPEIDGEQTFHFQYHITVNNCEEQADLSFTVYQEYDPGGNAVVAVCIDDDNFELFDSLNGMPDDIGSWSGPNDFTSANNLVEFNPNNFEEGDYIYTVPSNGTCEEKSATVTVNIYPLSNAGDDVNETVCKLDNQVDLFDLLDSDVDLGGTFTDLDNTNALSGSIVDLSLLTNNTYRFQYEVQPNESCSLASSIINLEVIDVLKPNVNDQSFCMGYGATIADLEVISNQDNYNWYADETDTTILNTDLILQNGTNYFVTAVNENGCESERVKVLVTLIEFGAEGCVSCVNDGVSANNDEENDLLELCDLPSIFPNFEIKIFNRYGNTIYLGNRNTPLFNGTSNVQLTLGDQVPSGVYFYIFNPNDKVTKPFQGDFYLSR